MVLELPRIHHVPPRHNIGSPIGTVAHTHVAAAMPEVGVFEFHGDDVPIWNKLVKGANKITGSGFISMTDEPDLSMELDEKVTATYSMKEKLDL